MTYFIYRIREGQSLFIIGPSSRSRQKHDSRPFWLPLTILHYIRDTECKKKKQSKTDQADSWRLYVTSWSMIPAKPYLIMNHLISKWGLFISKKDEVTVLPLVTKAFYSSLPTNHPRLYSSRMCTGNSLFYSRCNSLELPNNMKVSLSKPWF